MCGARIRYDLANKKYSRRDIKDWPTYPHSTNDNQGLVQPSNDYRPTIVKTQYWNWVLYSILPKLFSKIMVLLDQGYVHLLQCVKMFQ